MVKKIPYVILILAGICLKFYFLNVKTGDFVGFIDPWLDFIRENGYEHSLKYHFYDYSPAYIYFLVIVAKLELNTLYAVKLFSVIFEYVIAYFIGKTAKLKTKSNSAVWISLAVIPLLPSILLNSSYLSQCDSIYTAFIVIAIYYSLKEKPILSVLFLGISFAFKMQGVFILPYFFVMMLRRKIPFYYFTIIPIIYFVSLLPAWFYGRPINDSLLTYIHQTDRWKQLTMNFPNLYMFIDNIHYDIIKSIGILLTATITLVSGLWLSMKKNLFTFDTWIKLAFMSAILVPFLLPGMHERYLYLGDVLGVLYFLIFRKNIIYPIGILSVSFYSYIRMSRFNDILPMEPALIIYMLVIILVIYDFIRSLKGLNEKN